MPLWDKLKTELDRAGKAAQTALDEGRVRLEAFRARQLADKAAQALGYAVFRARQEQRDLDPESLERLTATIAGHEAEVRRNEAILEEQLAARGGARPADGGAADAAASAGAAGTAAPQPRSEPGAPSATPGGTT